MIKISNSALQQFLSGCPGRLKYFQEYKLKEQYLPRHMKFGIEVHRLVEDGLPARAYEHGIDPVAADIARKMIKVLKKQGYEILDREVWHHAPLTDEIEVVGVIDIVARNIDGIPVLIDLKTGARQWVKLKQTSGELRIPKAETFQAPIYLTAPYEDPYFNGEWPQRLDYLMVPNDGRTKIHPFYESDDARDNLIQACELLKASEDAGYFVLNRGWLCGDCDWRRLCWKQPNWKRYYDER